MFCLKVFIGIFGLLQIIVASGINYISYFFGSTFNSDAAKSIWAFNTIVHIMPSQRGLGEHERKNKSKLDHRQKRLAFINSEFLADKRFTSNIPRRSLEYFLSPLLQYLLVKICGGPRPRGAVVFGAGAPGARKARLTSA